METEGGGSGWEEMQGGTWRTRGRGNCGQDILCEKKKFISTKGKNEQTSSKI